MRYEAPLGGVVGPQVVAITCEQRAPHGFEDDPAHQRVPHRLLDPLPPRKMGAQGLKS
jgi:hypothetical protein